MVSQALVAGREFKVANKLTSRLCAGSPVAENPPSAISPSGLWDVRRAVYTTRCDLQTLPQTWRFSSLVCSSLSERQTSKCLVCIPIRGDTTRRSPFSPQSGTAIDNLLVFKHVKSPDGRRLRCSEMKIRCPKGMRYVPRRGAADLQRKRKRCSGARARFLVALIGFWLNGTFPNFQPSHDLPIKLSPNPNAELTLRRCIHPYTVYLLLLSC